MVAISIKNGNQDGFLYEASVQDTNDDLIRGLVRVRCVLIVGGAPVSGSAVCSIRSLLIAQQPVATAVSVFSSTNRQPAAQEHEPVNSATSHLLPSDLIRALREG